MSDRYFLDAVQVAEILNVGKSTLYQLADRGDLPFPYHRFGRAVRFKRNDIEKYLGESLPFEGEVTCAQ